MAIMKVKEEHSKLIGHGGNKKIHSAQNYHPRMRAKRKETKATGILKEVKMLVSRPTLNDVLQEQNST